MTIVILTSDYKPCFGGVAEYTFQLAKAFAKMNHRIILLAPSYGQKEESFDSAQPFETIRLNKMLFIPLLFLHYLYFLFVKKADLFFDCMWYPCGLVSYLLGIIKKHRYVIAAHGVEVIDGTSKKFRKRLKRMFRFLRVCTYGGAVSVFAVSNYTKNKLIELGIKPENVICVPNGVDSDNFNGGVDETGVLKRFPVIGKNRIVLSISRLYDYKGQDMVIRAMPEVLKKSPDTVFVIGGQGPYLSELEEIRDELDLNNKVVFLGKLSEAEKFDILNKSDVFVLASREDQVCPNVEGFGISLIEASVFKKPVIGGNSGGIPDAVRDGVTGLLVNPLDPGDIADKIIKVLNNQSYARRLGENGYKRVQEELNWGNVAEKMSSHL